MKVQHWETDFEINIRLFIILYKTQKASSPLEINKFTHINFNLHLSKALIKILTSRHRLSIDRRSSNYPTLRVVQSLSCLVTLLKHDNKKIIY